MLSSMKIKIIDWVYIDMYDTLPNSSTRALVGDLFCGEHHFQSENKLPYPHKSTISLM
jgi:hypothetical protein